MEAPHGRTLYTDYGCIPPMNLWRRARDRASCIEDFDTSGLADRVPKSPTRGKSPLSSRSRASSRARSREGEGTKRDRDGRNLSVRPSLEPPTPFSPRGRGFSDSQAGDYDAQVRLNTHIAFGSGSPYGPHAGQHAVGAHAHGAPSYAYQDSWHGAGDGSYRAPCHESWYA